MAVGMIDENPLGAHPQCMCVVSVIQISSQNVRPVSCDR